MTTEKRLMIIGPKSIIMNGLHKTKYRRVEVWYDSICDSCKIVINDKLNMIVPIQDTFSPEDLDVACICLASLLEAFGHRAVAKEILGCYSRFRISNEG